MSKTLMTFAILALFVSEPAFSGREAGNGGDGLLINGKPPDFRKDVASEMLRI